MKGQIKYTHEKDHNGEYVCASISNSNNHTFETDGRDEQDAKKRLVSVLRQYAKDGRNAQLALEEMGEEPTNRIADLEQSLRESQGREAAYREALEIVKANLENEVGLLELFDPSRLHQWPDVLECVTDALASPAPAVLTELAELKVENAELKNLLVTTESVHFEKDHMNATLSSPLLPIIAESLARSFEDAGGVNYIQWTLNDNGIGAFDLTMQRHEGKTPADLVAEQREELKELARRAEVAEEALKVMADDNCCASLFGCCTRQSEIGDCDWCAVAWAYALAEATVDEGKEAQP